MQFIKEHKKMAKWLCLAGSVTCFCGFMIAGFDLKKLSSQGPYEQRTAEQAIDGVEQIVVDSSFEDIQIVPSKDEQMHITYYENKQSTYEIKKEKGTISILKKNSRRFYEHFMSIDFSHFDQDISLRIEIPVSYKHDLSVDSTNGAISLQDLPILSDIALETSFGAIEVQNIESSNKLTLDSTNGGILVKNVNTKEDLHVSTSFGIIELINVEGASSMYVDSTNGALTFQKVTVKQELEAETSFDRIDVTKTTAGKTSLSSTNGTIELHDAYTTSSLDIETSFGDIIFDLVTADHIKLDTTNGEITGTIKGKQSEYTIDSDSTNGNTTLLSGRGTTDKTLHAETSFGDCSIMFMD